MQPLLTNEVNIMYPSLSTDKSDGDAPKRDTIETSIDTLTNRIEDLSFNLSQLKDKANPFLRDSVTSCIKENGDANKKNDSILKTVIDKQIDRVNDLNEFVNDLIYRLDI